MFVGCQITKMKMKMKMELDLLETPLCLQDTLLRSKHSTETPTSTDTSKQNPPCHNAAHVRKHRWHRFTRAKQFTHNNSNTVFFRNNHFCNRFSYSSQIRYSAHSSSWFYCCCENFTNSTSNDPTSFGYNYNHNRICICICICIYKHHFDSSF